MSMVTVICTKCGKSNQVEFKGARYNARCGGCSQLMPVGGRETGLKALPWAWISLTFGILTIMAVPIIWLLAKGTDVDPLDKHRVVLRKKALSIASTAKYPKWRDFRIRYVLSRFDEKAKFTCTRIAYTYTDEEGHKHANQFAMKFNRTSKDEEVLPVWQPTEIAVLDRLRIKDQIEWNSHQAQLKAETGHGNGRKKKKDPAAGNGESEQVKELIPIKPYSHECDLIDNGFMKYRWLDWDPLAHGKIVRGEPVPDILKSLRSEYRRKMEFENKMKK
ncbi:MAG: hypothetical protein QGF00_31890 [Planctomycetota bacterium]|nr:hypothetical protein [Planctomycetota bacterium]MDP7254244.1 hypothetical protein [Planctomycetota bacterium]